jgi:hypothetical protein
MCRYAFYKYKTTYGCFNCQVGFKRRNIFDVDPNATEAKDFHCPNCGGEMANLGRDLRLPTKHKDKEWACIKYLVDNKYNIYSCGCQGIGFVPQKMEDAVSLVSEYAQKQKLYLKQDEINRKFEEKQKAKKRREKERKTKAILREIKKEEQ